MLRSFKEAKKADRILRVGFKLELRNTCKLEVGQFVAVSRGSHVLNFGEDVFIHVIFQPAGKGGSRHCRQFQRQAYEQRTGLDEDLAFGGRTDG